MLRQASSIASSDVLDIEEAVNIELSPSIGTTIGSPVKTPLSNKLMTTSLTSATATSILGNKISPLSPLKPQG